ncbi:MAG: sensor histidine kinase [Actinobacteria bacterium]|nr:sensor histidine kinase [Actinomycetota bacterium]
MTFPLTDDAQVRAMVALLEAQAAQITALRRGVETLEGRLSLRNALDVVVSDEVQQSLADLRMALHALRRLPAGDRQCKWLVDEASARVELLTTRIGELLAPAPLADVTVERDEAKDVPFDEIVARALAAIPTLPAGTVTCRNTEGLSVSTTPARLAAVLAALIDNAARHGGGTAVTCDAELAFGDLVVRVSDEGPGLGDVDPESLFPALARGLGADDDTRGVGLYVARMLARSLGGDVSLANRPEGGAVASVVIPQRRGDDAAPRTGRDLTPDW